MTIETTSHVAKWASHSFARSVACETATVGNDTADNIKEEKKINLNILNHPEFNLHL
jgi:hypothetical protein